MSIETAQLTKRFGTTAVLRGIDLNVREGELVALLKIIAGLEWPDAGKLRVDGGDWLGLAAQDRRIGFVFQSYALFPHMSVRDNVAFSLSALPRARRPEKGATATRVTELLTFL